ncbi:hypothetical protein FJ251_07890 [bacterium]|nr:hypothetical protein [bacterium]
MHITPDEERRIEAAAEQLEARTGVQVLAAVIGKADHYPEVPWKAFALTTALAVLALADDAAAGESEPALFEGPDLSIMERILIGAFVLFIVYLVGFPIAKLLVSRASWYGTARKALKTKGTARIGGFTFGGSGSGGGSRSSGARVAAASRAAAAARAGAGPREAGRGEDGGRGLARSLTHHDILV